MMWPGRIPKPAVRAFFPIFFRLGGPGETDQDAKLVADRARPAVFRSCVGFVPQRVFAPPNNAKSFRSGDLIVVFWTV